MKKYKAFTSSPVLVDPNDICNAVVGLKATRVLHYQRQGPVAEIGIEQIIGEVLCPKCQSVASVKDRPWVIYVDLPFGGTPVRIAWRKHRVICVESSCEQGSWTLGDHRIAAARSLLTTRAAKWATKQVGGGRTVTEVAAELGCVCQLESSTPSVRCPLTTPHSALRRVGALRGRQRPIPHPRLGGEVSDRALRRFTEQTRAGNGAACRCYPIHWAQPDRAARPRACRGSRRSYWSRCMPAHRVEPADVDDSQRLTFADDQPWHGTRYPWPPGPEVRRRDVRIGTPLETSHTLT